jgi:hypothetical protein
LSQNLPFPLPDHKTESREYPALLSQPTGFRVGRRLEENHGSAVKPAEPVLALLNQATADGFCLRSANYCVAQNSHPRGTFHFAFLSLEVEIRSIDEALAACLGPMKQKSP